MRYYLKKDDNNTPTALIRYDGEEMIEQYWDRADKKWENTAAMTSTWIRGGDTFDFCTLEEAKAFCLDPFLIEERQLQARREAEALIAQTLATDPTAPAEAKQVLNAALELAFQAHLTQFRRDNQTPYIVHPVEVAKRVQGWQAVAVAFLHDVMEDNAAYTEAVLAQQGIPTQIIAATAALTHHRTPEQVERFAQYPEEGQLEYLDYVRRQVLPNPLARVVKIADIQCNLAGTPTQKQVERYEKALLLLQGQA